MKVGWKEHMAIVIKSPLVFYNDMVKKYQINKYQVIQQNYEMYPLLRGFFYEKELRKDKKFILILNYPD